MSWNTVYVPLNLILNALAGGPILAIAGLRAAGVDMRAGRIGRVLASVAAVALVANTVTFCLQGAELGSIENSFVTAAQTGSFLGPDGGRVRPCWGRRALSSTVLRSGAVPVCRLRAQRVRPFSFWRAFSSCGLPFYMMHMTVGLGV